MLRRCLALAFCLTFICASVQSENFDTHTASTQRRQFRSAKVNQLWEKAQRFHIDDVALSDLYGELREHDHLLMDLKKIKAQGGDRDGVMTSQLQLEFDNIMIKYGLGIFAGDNDELDKFKDPRLNKLWYKAVQSEKFSADELDKLYVEFKHHQDNQLEHGKLKNDVKEITELSENSIERHQRSEDLKNKKAKLSNLEEEMHENMLRLNHLATKHKASDTLFIEPKVVELWQAAKEGNFTDDELQSIKEELAHFEMRLGKHRFFREELKNSAEKIEFHGGKHEAPTERVTRHQKLLDKVKDLGDKVQKLFSGLKSRIKKGVVSHNEL